MRLKSSPLLDKQRLDFRPCRLGRETCSGGKCSRKAYPEWFLDNPVSFPGLIWDCETDSPLEECVALCPEFAEIRPPEPRDGYKAGIPNEKRLYEIASRKAEEILSGK